MIVKEHITQDGRLILAVCDSDLLGKKFEEGDRQLDLTSQFYKGAEMTEEEVLRMLPKVCSMDIVGKKSIAFAEKYSLIDPARIMYIKKIPHAQCVFDAKANS